ncbi:hypothetical protein FHU30_005031 [Actinomadura rupiterrae]|nr:hypothetical protein [Actinomadura rupiterrae]MCP2339662.1 hypothetical protein [Actinomadura rupiterrae]
MVPQGELRFDPSALSAAQREGDACVVCHKRWPRPRVRVGRLPDGREVVACDDCAPVLPVPRARSRVTRNPKERDTDAEGPVVEPASATAAAFQ